MSLITCCPACGTMFRVVPDQLKISEGWVRCGHCNEVFDASACLVDPPVAGAAPQAPAPEVPAPMDVPAAPEPAAPPVAARPPAPAAPEPAAPPPQVELPVPQATPVALAPPPPAPSVAEALQPPAPVASVIAAPPPAPAMRREDPAPDSELQESELDQPFVFRRSDLALAEDVPVSPPVVESRFGPSPAAASRFHADSGFDTDADDSELEDVSFLRAARRSAFWRRPAVRALLVVVALLLAAVLAAQVGVHDRDRLAVAYPELKPALAALCQPLGCRVGPPRQIESVLIDSSSFNKLRPDAYRLNFTLKNGAPIPIAVPAMELTLTDTQDQPVLRRVLTPGEMGAAQPTLAAGAEWSGSVTLAVAANGQAARIAGYRLLAFYP